MESSSSSDSFLQVTEISRAGCLKELKCQISFELPTPPTLIPSIYTIYEERLHGKHLWNENLAYKHSIFPL